MAETLVDRGLLTVDEGANPAVLCARPAAEAVAVYLCLVAPDERFVVGPLASSEIYRTR